MATMTPKICRRTEVTMGAKTTPAAAPTTALMIRLVPTECDEAIEHRLD